MFACNTLCVSVPPTETSRHAVAWREVSGCPVHCKESLGEKKQEYLRWLYTCKRLWRAVKARFFICSVSIHMLPKVMYGSQSRHLLSCGKGACGFSRAVKFRPLVLQKNLPLSLTGECICLQKT